MSDLVIVEVPEENALSLFTTDKGLDPLLKQVFDAIDGFVPDIETAKGRKEIASMAHKVSKSKTAIDSVGKTLVSKLKEQPKLVDAERKRVRDLLDDLRDKVRKPLTDWEEKEDQRIEKIKSIIESFSQYKDLLAINSLTLYQADILIGDLDAFVVDESLCEFREEAEQKLKLAKLELAEIRRKLKSEDDARIKAENERLEVERKAQEEREKQIALEAEQRAKVEAEQAAAKVKAESERKEREAKEAAEKRELELKLAKEQAEREKLEAEQRAKMAEEEAARKVEAEKQAAIQAEAAREADVKHRTKINNECLRDLIKIGLDEEIGKKIITAICKGGISHVSISY